MKLKQAGTLINDQSEDLKRAIECWMLAMSQLILDEYIAREDDEDFNVYETWDLIKENLE